MRTLTGLPDQEIDELISLLRSLAMLTTDLYDIQVVIDDPDDNKFLACSLEALADYLVSLDDHLLSLKQFRLIDYQVQIVAVAKFAELLELQSTRT